MSPGGVREVVREAARVGINPPPQIEQPGRRVARGAEGPKRVVLLVEDLVCDRQRSHRTEDMEQVLAVAVGRVRSEIDSVFVERPFAPVAGTGEAWRVDKRVVFEEPHEDASENPGDGHLRQALFAPCFVGAGGPFARERLPVFLL